MHAFFNEAARGFFNEAARGFFNGAVLGFLVAAPVGPIGLLCISRTIRAGWLAGFASGLGAATADCAYASLAAFGMAAVTRGAQSIAMPVHIVGAALLFWMGIRELRAKPRGANETGAVPSPLGAFATTLGLTLLNPATIVSFIAIFAAASVATPSPGAAAQIVAGVFTGSALWWLILSSVTAIVRRVAGPATFHRIGIGSGLCLIAFALYAFFAPLATARALPEPTVRASERAASIARPCRRLSGRRTRNTVRYPR